MSSGGVKRQLEVELVESAGPPGTDDDRSTNQILNALVADVEVLSFEVEGSRLQDAFLELTEGARS